jgi:hypothetical protein
MPINWVHMKWISYCQSQAYTNKLVSPALIPHTKNGKIRSDCIIKQDEIFENMWKNGPLAIQYYLTNLEIFLVFAQLECFINNIL